jgi:NADPH-dependent 2,4-dienoyl-CoA reductase/sulfur reductase-like enzyme
MTTVAVIGGGYGGITAAKALDDIADVTLIEPRDKFVHNVATLRAVVAPEWAERLFLPYDHLLAHGTIVRERATRISGTQLELASGTVLEPDFTVVATGSSHRYPAKLPMTDSASAKEQLRRTHEALSQAARVVLLGAGRSVWSWPVRSRPSGRRSRSPSLTRPRNCCSAATRRSSPPKSTPSSTGSEWTWCSTRRSCGSPPPSRARWERSR